MELVCRKGEHINIHFFDINFDMSCCLYCIGMEQHTSLSADCTNFFDWMNGTDFIVCKHDRNQSGFGTDCFFDILRINLTFAVYRNIGNFKTFFFQTLCRMNQCMMFDSGGDEVIFAFVL